MALSDDSGNYGKMKNSRQMALPGTPPLTGRRSILAGIIILAGVSFFLYIPALDADFVYDSRAQILIDDFIHDPHNLWQVISLQVLGQDVMDFNRPAMLLSLMLDALFWGKNPFGYHLSNVLIHTINVLLLFLLLLHFSNRTATADAGQWGAVGAFLGALFFAVHPINTEAVCCVSYREDLLVTFFLLAALHFASQFDSSAWKTNFLTGAGCCMSLFLAVSAKESGVTGPVIIILYYSIFRSGKPPKLWFILAGLSFAMVGTFLTVRFILESEVSIIFPTKPTYLDGSFKSVFAVQPRIWTFYLQQIIWPAALCADYGPYSIRHISLLSSLMILTAILVGTIFAAGRSKGILFAIGFYWISLLPVSNFIPIYRPIADRFLYTPLLGVGALIAVMFLLCMRIRSRYFKIFVVCAFLTACLVLAGVSHQRQKAWHDRLSLWQDTLQKNPLSSTAANNLAFAWFDKGEFKHAIEIWKKTLILTKGKEADAWAGLAIGYEAIGSKEMANQAYGRAIGINSRYKIPNLLMKSAAWDQNQLKYLRQILKRHSR